MSVDMPVEIVLVFPSALQSEVLNTNLPEPIDVVTHFVIRNQLHIHLDVSGVEEW